MVPAFQMELGLDDMGKVVEVTDKKFDPEQREKMEAVQKKIMALNVGISGRTYGTDNPPEAMTPEKMKEKMEAVRQFEVEAMEIRSKLYIVGEAKTDSPIVGKKIWEFEVK